MANRAGQPELLGLQSALQGFYGPRAAGASSSSSSAGAVHPSPANSVEQAVLQLAKVANQWEVWVQKIHASQPSVEQQHLLASAVSELLLQARTEGSQARRWAQTLGTSNKGLDAASSSLAVAVCACRMLDAALSLPGLLLPPLPAEAATSLGAALGLVLPHAASAWWQSRVSGAAACKDQQLASSLAYLLQCCGSISRKVRMAQLARCSMHACTPL
jgi:hypothetical protein